MSFLSRCQTRSHAPRRAFTLLEVVIASLLVAVLMASVYQVLFIYRKMFDRGETQTEEIQLVRSLSQQLSDDLVGAIQDPVFIGGKARGPSGARRFGLYGNATELRIDVLQIPAFQVAPTPTAEEMEDTTQPRKLQAPELRTVYYSFLESVSVDSALSDDRVGLTRRELDFETPEEVDDSEMTGTPELALTQGTLTMEGTLAEDTLTEDFEEVVSGANASTFDQLLEVGMDSSLMWAPEVVSLKFRYFDGSKWRKSWDSLARKGLPVAVEMTLAVVSLEDADTFRNAASGMTQELGDELLVEDDSLTLSEQPMDELSIDELSVDTQAVDEVSADAQGIDLTPQQNLPPLHLHRVVVHLPNSPLQKELQPVKQQAAPTLEVPTLTAPAALPKVIVQPARPKTRTNRAAPDQWMRNE